jgi:hypothetical protein
MTSSLHSVHTHGRANDDNKNRTPHRQKKTPNIRRVQHAVYAATYGAQESRPDSGIPIASGFRNSTDKLGLANITIQKAEPTSTHSIRHEIEKHLERHVDEKTREVDTRLLGRFAQEFEVQAPARPVREGRVGKG